MLFDGRPVRMVTVTGHRLYELAASLPGRADSYHELELRLSSGVEAYAFTFGS